MDVTTIDSIVRTEITQIRMLFIVEQTGSNVATFNEKNGYHVDPEYGPLGSHLKKFSNEIYENWYHGF